MLTWKDRERLQHILVAVEDLESWIRYAKACDEPVHTVTSEQSMCFTLSLIKEYAESSASDKKILSEVSWQHTIIGTVNHCLSTQQSGWQVFSESVKHAILELKELVQGCLSLQEEAGCGST